MTRGSRVGILAGIGDRLSDLLDAQTRVGTQVVGAMNRNGLSTGRGCCDIPEPCWMPESLGEVESRACPGATVTVRLLITNCDRVPRTMTMSAAGEAAGLVNLQPTTLVLGPKERGAASATLKVAPDAAVGEEIEALLWVLGCREHYLRWTVVVGKRGGDCYHEVKFEDCPDLVHHWYDHFYCRRPCLYQQSSNESDD